MARSTTRRALRVIFPVLLLLALAAAPLTAFAAGPAGAASCMGIELAAINPPGTSDEEPGGARQFVGEIKEAAAFFGWPIGALDAYIAHLHLHTHDDCDAALGG